MSDKKMVIVSKRGYSSIFKDIPILLNQARQAGYAQALKDAAKYFEDMKIDNEWYPLDIAEELIKLSRESR